MITHITYVPWNNQDRGKINQHFYWIRLQRKSKATIKKYETCQWSKKSNLKFGHIPEKEAETYQWDKICVDLIGPYTILCKGKHKSDLTLRGVTMINPTMGWFEIATYDDKKTMTIANIVEFTWLSRYPRPTDIIVDRGK